MVRFKNRWLLVELLPAGDAPPHTSEAGLHHHHHQQQQQQRHQLSSKLLWSALKQSIIAHFGDTGWGAVSASLTIKYFSPLTNLAILRVARADSAYRTAWAGLTLLGAVDGVRVVPRVVHVSGTIKQTQLAAIAHNRAVVARYRARAQSRSRAPPAAAAYEAQDSYARYLEGSEREIGALQD